MNVLKAIALAEIQHAELLEHAEQIRLAQGAMDSRQGRKPRGSVVREGLAALRARIGAMRRPVLAGPSDLAPAATETT